MDEQAFVNEPKRVAEPEIPTQIKELQEKLSHCQDVLKLLEERLSPVLTIGDAKKEEEAERSMNTKMGSDLNGASILVRIITEDIDSLIDRLEL